MNKFNLVDDKWIIVLNNDYKKEKLSLKELFENTQNIQFLAGEAQAQNFVIMRFLLSILHTVFSRVDIDGNPYEYLEIDDKYFQLKDVEEEDSEDYIDDLYETWEKIWNNKKFPNVVIDYLEKNKDSFEFFDDKRPFMQVKRENVEGIVNLDDGDKITKSRTYFMTMNINVGETRNSVNIFNKKAKDKNIATPDEIVRWFLFYQNHSGTGEKDLFKNAKYKNGKSIGWTYTLGATFFRGNNLFDTLMLNFALVHPVEYFNTNKQRPIWEYNPEEIMKNRVAEKEIDNLAELYTAPSRATYIDPDFNLNEDFYLRSVKYPAIRRENQNLEIMTLWESKKDVKKDTISNYPKKYDNPSSLWKSFGTITNQYKDVWGTGIFDFLENIHDYLNDEEISLVGLSISDNNNKASMKLTGEVYNELIIEDNILTNNDWKGRITGEVEKTKKIIEKSYGIFLENLSSLKGIYGNTQKTFIKQNKEKIYFRLTEPFEEWISDLKVDDNKDERMLEWRKTLNEIIQEEINQFIENLNPKDYEFRDGKNIITIYNDFQYFLQKEIKLWRENGE